MYLDLRASRMKQPKKDEETNLMATTQETVLSVPDVSCEHCVKTINGALGALPGVEMAITDIPTKTVAIRYDPSQVSLPLQMR